MKDCNYPNCFNCTKEDCDKEQKDIQALIKRRRWRDNPQKYNEKQRKYRQKIREKLPQCDNCENCVLVEKEKQDGYRRLCVERMKLIEQKVSNSPKWCSRRVNRANNL